MTLTLRAARLDPADYPCRRNPSLIGARTWHAFLKRRLWSYLPLPANGKGAAHGLEYRNCYCGSTICKPVEEVSE